MTKLSEIPGIITHQLDDAYSTQYKFGFGHACNEIGNRSIELDVNETKELLAMGDRDSTINHGKVMSWEESINLLNASLGSLIRVKT